MTVRTIELSDEVHQESPLAYLVFPCVWSCLVDYKVFTDLVEAEHYAADQQEEAGVDGWPIYPLYAAPALG